MAPVSRFPILVLVLFVLNLALVHGAVAAGPGYAHALFSRDDTGPTCVQGCGAAPDCDCDNATERCEITVQTCIECSQMKCVPLDTDVEASSSVSKGAVIGASIGGLVVAMILGFVVYRFCCSRRNGRRSMASAAEKENDFGMLKSARASTHTVASIASTVRTRASNVIQIAYIPGVTNRSSPSTPAHLIPPVPPLPYSDSPVGSQFPGSPNIDIQFAAHDILRGSMCTVDNRSSIATTIYGGNAIVSQPNIIRAGKAAVVTVKGGSSAGTSTNGSPQTENIPPVPSIMYTPRSNNLGDVPPSPAFSVGSTFINRLNSRKGSITTISDQPQQRITQAGTHVIHENNSSSSLNYDSDDGASLMPGHSAKPQSDCSSCITDLGVGSPFSDDNENSMMIDIGAPHGTGVGITRKLSMTASGGKSNNGPRLISLKKPREPKRTISPFDDSHSVDKGR